MIPLILQSYFLADSVNMYILSTKIVADRQQPYHNLAADLPATNGLYWGSILREIFILYNY